MKAKKLNKNKILIIGGICLIILAIIAIPTLGRNRESYDEEIAKTQNITTYYSFSGNIEAKDNQTVVSSSMLPIKEFYVREGDLVKKGDVLFILDDSNVSASVDQAAASVEIARINYENMKSVTKDQQLLQVSNALESAQLNFNEAEVNFERTTGLFNTGGISTHDLEQAQRGYDGAKLQLELAQKNYSITEKSVEQNILTARAQLSQAEASLEAAKKQVGDLEITAESDGEISKIYVEENESLITGTSIMDIVNYDDLEVSIRVDEFDIGTITEGKEVIVTVNSLGKDVIGRVSDVSKEAQTVNNVSFFTASIDLEENEGLRVGLSTEVKSLNSNVSNATTISMKALQFDDYNQTFVYYRDSNNNVETKFVTVGINDGNTVEILDGIKSGEVVLVPLRSVGIQGSPDIGGVRQGGTN